jgi:Arc/MetJ family transcription regulator
MSRTNIDIDDELMAETMRITGQKTKRGAVEEAMRSLVRDDERRRILADLIESTKGIGWEGDLDQMRRERAFAEDPRAFDHEK